MTKRSGELPRTHRRHSTMSRTRTNNEPTYRVVLALWRSHLGPHGLEFVFCIFCLRMLLHCAYAWMILWVCQVVYCGWCHTVADATGCWCMPYQYILITYLAGATFWKADFDAKAVDARRGSRYQKLEIQRGRMVRESTLFLNLRNNDGDL